MAVPAILYYGGLGALRAVPSLFRAGKAGLSAIRGGAIKRGLKDYFLPGSKRIGTGKGLGSKVVTTAPGIARPGKYFSNYALTSAPFGYAAYDYLTGDAEQSVADGQRTGPSPATPGGPVGTTIEEGKATGIIKDKKEKPNDAKITSDQIKSGELDDFIKERIDLFEKYIGDDTRKRTKTAGYNAMVQFGLNLATKRGNLIEGIAESAKEPLKEFAKLGNDLMDRAASIKKAGIESGVSAYDKAQDREIDEKAIAADIIKERIKANARKLSPGEFYAKTMADIQSSDELRSQIESVNYKEDGRTLVDEPVPVETLYERYINDSYNSYNAVEIPKGQAGQELIQTLPSGTRFYDLETGKFGRIP
jgi:hypothetical protein